MSEQLFDADLPAGASEAEMVPGTKARIVKAVYLMALAIAMTGWLWLIVRCVGRLI